MADDAMLDADTKAREAALDTTRSFIVQAPAGSGKTELLIQRYLGLLARVDSPEEVLAITFTRKAAAEMLKRVMTQLESALEPMDDLAEHERVTREAARLVLMRDRERSWHLLQHARRLKIQTLDSLNAGVARMLPVTAAANIAGSAVADEAQTRALYRQAALATLEWLNSDSDYAAAIERVLQHLDNNTDLYTAYLASMLGVRDQWLPFIGSGQLTDAEFSGLRQELENDLKGIRRQHVESVVAHAAREQLDALESIAQTAAATLRAEGRGAHLLCQAQCDRAAAEWWPGVAEMLLTREGEWRSRLTVASGFARGANELKQQALDLMTEFERQPRFRALLHAVRDLPPADYTDSQWDVLVALIRLLPLAVFELQTQFTRRGMTDFVEIARAADAALGTTENPSDVALLLDYQVRHILVDEMQDTSLAQYEMIEALTRGWSTEEGRTLFCVGDPMQSIYRFRNAEVAQFLTARREGLGGVALNELILRRNFRSGEYLVDWFNEVFPVVLPPEDDPVTSAVSYEPCIAAENHRGAGEVRIHPVLGTNRSDEAGTGLEAIQEILEENPDDSVAVLVRSRTVLPELLDRLRLAGIAYEAIDIDRLTDLPEVIEVLALTRAAVHPGDRQAWLAILRAPWLGLDWTDLHSLVKNDTGSSVWELLHDEARLEGLGASARAAIQRALPALAELRKPRRFESLRDVVERVWITLGGPLIPDTPEAIDNVYRLLSVIDKLEQAGTLDDVAELEAELDLVRVSTVRPARVQVMTMHKAKGLQFDHVVLYGLGRAPGSSREGVLSWFELPPADGPPRKVLGPIGPRAVVDRDPIHRFIGSIGKARDRFETGRLLYVACTRAKRSLHLIGHARVSETLDEVKRPDPRSLLYLLWPFVESAFEDALGTMSPGTEDDTRTWVLPMLRRFPKPWSTPPAPPPPVALESSRALPEQPVDYEWVGSEARLAGSLTHLWLKRVAEGRATLDAFTAPENARLIDGWMAELGVSEAQREDVFDRSRVAIETMTQDPKGNWLATGEGHSELSLTGVIGEDVVTGVIDRVVIDEGTHWIVDYKTGSHEGGSLDGFLAAERERYRPQLRRYQKLYEAWSGETARCALYFPILAEFVEVDVEQPD